MRPRRERGWCERSPLPPRGAWSSSCRAAASSCKQHRCARGVIPTIACTHPHKDTAPNAAARCGWQAGGCAVGQVAAAGPVPSARCAPPRIAAAPHPKATQCRERPRPSDTAPRRARRPPQAVAAESVAVTAASDTDAVALAAALGDIPGVTSSEPMVGATAGITCGGSGRACASRAATRAPCRARCRGGPAPPPPPRAPRRSTRAAASLRRRTRGRPHPQPRARLMRYLRDPGPGGSNAPQLVGIDEVSRRYKTVQNCSKRSETIRNDWKVSSPRDLRLEMQRGRAGRRPAAANGGAARRASAAGRRGAALRAAGRG